MTIHSKNIFKIHHLSRTVPEFVHVHDHFYLNPLLEEVSKNIRIFVLAISQKKVDFFEAVEDGIFPVLIEDLVVKNMQEALNIDESGVDDILFEIEIEAIEILAIVFPKATTIY